MPLTFPSHQGLILPVWAKWPRHVNGLALCVGAAAPDLVDSAFAPFRGHFSQGLGHSLLGLVVFCVPAGLLLTFLLQRVRRSGRGGAWLALLDNPGDCGRINEAWRLCVSVFVGAASHLFFDFFTHGTFVLLLPWYESRDCFPTWWYHEWTTIPLPWFEKPYPFAPHTVVWIVATVIGAVLYVRILKRRGARQKPSLGSRVV